MVLECGALDWERLAIFLKLLLPRLPKLPDDDPSQGVLDAVDLDSYWSEARECVRIALEDEDGVVDPVPLGKGGGRPDPELDPLSEILKEFNERWGRVANWKDKDRVERLVTVDIPGKVAADEATRCSTPTRRTPACKGAWRCLPP